MNSCQKGKRGERELRDVIRANGFDCRRGQQFSGSPDSPDVVSSDLKAVHFECKRTEKLSIYAAMAQAQTDCGNKHPIVAHKKNHAEWLFVMTEQTLFALIKDGIDELTASGFVKQQ